MIGAVRISYSLEAPVWKATYRILLGEENSAAEDKETKDGKDKLPSTGVSFLYDSRDLGEYAHRGNYLSLWATKTGWFDNIREYLTTCWALFAWAAVAMGAAQHIVVASTEQLDKLGSTWQVPIGEAAQDEVVTESNCLRPSSGVGFYPPWLLPAEAGVGIQRTPGRIAKRCVITIACDAIRRIATARTAACTNVRRWTT